MKIKLTLASIALASVFVSGCASMVPFPDFKAEQEKTAKIQIWLKQYDAISDDWKNVHVIEASLKAQGIETYIEPTTVELISYDDKPNYIKDSYKSFSIMKSGKVPIEAIIEVAKKSSAQKGSIMAKVKPADVEYVTKYLNDPANVDTTRIHVIVGKSVKESGFTYFPKYESIYIKSAVAPAPTVKPAI